MAYNAIFSDCFVIWVSRINVNGLSFIIFHLNLVSYKSIYSKSNKNNLIIRTLLRIPYLFLIRNCGNTSLKGRIFVLFCVDVVRAENPARTGKKTFG